MKYWPSRTDRNRFHVLAVDDEENIREPLAHFLHRAGYRVSVAECGAEATDRFQNDRPDLVILDAAMPGMSGFEVLDVLRDRDASVPILMLTGHAKLQEVQEHPLGPPDAYLQKPTHKRRLLETVRYLLESACVQSGG